MNDVRNTILTVKDLTIAFGKDDKYTEVAKNVSFVLQKGECLGIVGESGSGKSVTSLSILDLLRSNPNNTTKGRILYQKQNQEVDILSLSPIQVQSIRGAKIAMIFQEPMSTFNPVRKCGPQVKEVLDIHDIGKEGERKNKVLSYFKRVTLPEVDRIYDSYPHELSGGQLQRVSIAMALVSQPDVIICDEPTTALDVTVQKEIIDLLKQIKKQENVSMIFVSHDLDVVADLCDRVVVMYKGDIVESGKLPEVFLHPSHRYTEALLTCKPRLDRDEHYLPTVGEIMSGSFTKQKRERKITSDQKPILTVSNLKVSFEKGSAFFWQKKTFLHAVNNVSFIVHKGEALGIVGESGSGKSTIANCIVGLLSPTEGIISYQGKEVTQKALKSDKKLRRDIQLVFQDPYSSLNPSMTVGAAVAEPIKYYKLHTNVNSRVNELFEKVGLPIEFRERYPHQLSGGQRQRVCIARALAVEPTLLVCDESVSALDVSVQAQILNLLYRLQVELGLTMIFISHDLSVVNYICDKVIVMKDGKVVESGICQEVISNPRKDYTKALVDSIPQSIST